MESARISKLKPVTNQQVADENKYKEGEIVFEKGRPSQKMIIERYADRVYYCKLQEAPHRKAIVYMERDLTAAGLSL